MRRVAVIACVVVAMLVALGIASITVLGASSRDAAGDPVTTTEAVSPIDVCYVEAMIYYRVSEKALAGLLADAPGITDAAAEAAAEAQARAGSDLETLRPWMREWARARPTEPAVEGPCAGHGSGHTQMPGIPSWSDRDRLAQAQGADAEQIYADLLAAQRVAMAALIEQILAAGPHARVVDAIAAARADEESITNR